MASSTCRVILDDEDRSSGQRGLHGGGPCRAWPGSARATLTRPRHGTITRNVEPRPDCENTTSSPRQAPVPSVARQRVRAPARHARPPPTPRRENSSKIRSPSPSAMPSGVHHVDPQTAPRRRAPIRTPPRLRIAHRVRHQFCSTRASNAGSLSTSRPLWPTRRRKPFGPPPCAQNHRRAPPASHRAPPAALPVSPRRRRAWRCRAASSSSSSIVCSAPSTLPARRPRLRLACTSGQRRDRQPGGVQRLQQIMAGGREEARLADDWRVRPPPWRRRRSSLVRSSRRSACVSSSVRGRTWPPGRSPSGTANRRCPAGPSSARRAPSARR